MITGKTLLSRSFVVAALLTSVLAAVLSSGHRADAAAGPFLPDLTVGDPCWIQGPEGPPKIRVRITNIGNDVAANRFAITVRGTLAQTGIYAIQHPEQAATLQPGQSFTVTITLSNRFTSNLVSNREVQVKLFFVSGGTRKPMEEHATANNRLPFDYQALPAC